MTKANEPDLTAQFMSGSAAEHDEIAADEDAAAARVQELQGHGHTALSPSSDDPDRNLVDPDATGDRDRVGDDPAM